MSKQKRESNLENKSKQTFLCCPCFLRRKPTNPPKVAEFSLDKNEPYDYVVEKLAIRKVPLALFATAEDLETQSLFSATAQSIMSQKPTKKAPLQEITSAAAITSYYNMIPQSEMDHISHSSANQQLTFPNEAEKELGCTGLHQRLPTTFATQTERDLCCMGLQHHKAKTVLNEDQEALLVSQVLNKHSSLYTLGKEPIPKDPDHFPGNVAVVPQSVQTAIARQQQQFPLTRNKVQVEVHKATVPQSKLHCCGKNMTPEIQQTINALAHAQKPHLPGVPPKNQKHLPKGLLSEASSEKEFCCDMLGPPEAVEGKKSYELGCHTLDITNKVLEGKKGYLNNRQRAMDECRHGDLLAQHVQYEPRFPKNNVTQQYNVESTDKSVLALSDITSTEVPFNKRIKTRSSMGQQYDDDQTDKSTTALSGRTSDEDIPALSADEAAKLDVLTRDSDHCTEISELKGQNLKWKIIIKHHSDKNKSEEKSGIEDSDSETEHEAFVHGKRSNSKR